MSVALTIDGKQVTAKEGETLLTVARHAGAEIPTLCNHAALEPRGACRLCLVEITNPKWPDWSKLVASCVYPVKEGLVVRTTTPEVEELRKMIVDLLLARCPDTEEITALGRFYGLEGSSFESTRDKDDHCILCGTCVRVCEDVIGASAIGISGRGATKRVGPAFGWVAETCIGCGSCAHACPTDAIKLEESDGVRRIWGKDFPLVACKECGALTLPEAQIEHMSERSGLARSYFELCDSCRRRQTAARFEEVIGR